MHNQGANGQWLQETLSFTTTFASLKKQHEKRKIGHVSFLVLTKGLLNMFGIEHVFGNMIFETIFGAFSKSSNKKSSVLQKHLVLRHEKLHKTPPPLPNNTSNADSRK